MFDIESFADRLNKTSLFEQFQRQDIPENVKTASANRQEYREWVADIDDDAVQSLDIASSVFAAHRIRVLEKPFQQQNSVKVTSVQRCGAVVSYEVTLGRFVVGLKLLNITDWERNRRDLPELARGTFGQICLLPTSTGEQVCKRICFSESIVLMLANEGNSNHELRANYYELRGVIIELAIAKFCSVLGIGVPIKTTYGFDIICFRDHAEFCMEKCLPFNVLSEPVSMKRIESRLKKCMRVMHLLQLVNKDIKPQNILYSPEVNDLVFCDFGISASLSQGQGFKSLTYKQGTMKYVSKEMRQLMVGEPGLVDLYYNDMHCLQATLAEIRCMKFVAVQCTPRQSFSNPLETICQTIFKIYCNAPFEVCTTKHPYREELNNYFPQLNGSQILSPRMMFLKIDFVVSSVALLSEMEYYLEMCDQSDPRIVTLTKRIRQWSTRQTIAAESVHLRHPQKRQFRRVLEREMKFINSSGKLTHDKERCLSKIVMQLFEMYVIQDEENTRCNNLLTILNRLKDNQNVSVEQVEFYAILYATAFESPLSQATSSQIEQIYSSLSLSQLALLESVMQRHGINTQYYCVTKKLASETSTQNADFVLYHKKTAVCCEYLEGQEKAIVYLEICLDDLDPKIKPTIWSGLAALLIDFYSKSSQYTALKKASVFFQKVPASLCHGMLYSVGKVYHSLGKNRQGLKCFELCCQLAGQDTGQRQEYLMAMQRISSLYVIIGQPDRAIAYSQSVIGKCLLLRDPSNCLLANSYFCLAEAISANGDFALALEYCRKGRKLTTWASRSLGIEINWVSVYSSIYRREIQRQPGKTRKSTLAAEVNRVLMQYVELYEQLALKTYSSSIFVDACLFLGENLMMLGNPEKALDVLNKGYRCKQMDHKTHACLLRWLGRCLVALNQQEQAHAKYEQLRRLSVQTSEKNENYSLLSKKTVQQALLALDLKIEQGAAECCDILENLVTQQRVNEDLTELGQRCYATGWFPLALRILRLQESYLPNSYQRYYMALCLYRSNQRQECLRILASLVRQEGLRTLGIDSWLCSRCCRTIAEAYQQDKAMELCLIYQQKELDLLRDAVKSDIRHIQATHRLAICLDRTGSSKEAWHFLQKAFVIAIQADPQVENIAIDCGLLSYRLEMYTKTSYYLNRIKRTSEENLLALFNLCRCYAVWKQAKRFYKTVWELIKRDKEGTYRNSLLTWLKETKRHAIFIVLLDIKHPKKDQGTNLVAHSSELQWKKQYLRNRLLYWKARCNHKDIPTPTKLLQLK